MWPDGAGPTLIVDDGGDATLFVHKAAEFEKAGKVPAFNPDKDPEEWGVILETIAQELKANPGRWTTIAKGIRGVSEETTTGVHRLYQMMEAGTLLFPAINVNDSVTKSKFDNIYGCRHSLPDGLARATDVMLGGKVAVVFGYGEVGQGLRAGAARPGLPRDRHRDRPDLRAAGGDGRLRGQDARGRRRDGGHLHHRDRQLQHHHRRPHGADEGQGDRRQHRPLRQRDRHGRPEEDARASSGSTSSRSTTSGSFPDGHSVMVLAEGRLLNLGCATGHPSFVMSASFTNQVLAQLELHANAEKYGKTVTMLPKELDEEVARLHLDHLGVKLTKLSKEQADYIGVPVGRAVQAGSLSVLVEAVA